MSRASGASDATRYDRKTLYTCAPQCRGDGGARALGATIEKEG